MLILYYVCVIFRLTPDIDIIVVGHKSAGYLDSLQDTLQPPCTHTSSQPIDQACLTFGIKIVKNIVKTPNIDALAKKADQ